MPRLPAQGRKGHGRDACVCLPSGVEGDGRRALLTLHNVYYQLNLMRQARKAILNDKYPEYVQEFLQLV